MKRKPNINGALDTVRLKLLEKTGSPGTFCSQLRLMAKPMALVVMPVLNVLVTGQVCCSGRRKEYREIVSLLTIPIGPKGGCIAWVISHHCGSVNG